MFRRKTVVFVRVKDGCERTPAYRGGSFMLQREQHH